MIWVAGSISGWRTAGTRITRELPWTVRRGPKEIASRTSSGPVPGRMTRSMCGRQTATVTTPTCDIRRMDSASRCPLKSVKRGGVMKLTRLIALSAALTCLPLAASAQGKPAPKDAVLYFVWPQDGATIKGGFWCRFGLRNMGVTHAGDNFQNSGHHHLLIDVNEPLDPNEPIAQDKSHLHFGAGQTEARIELPPGKHTLQLVLGDAGHYPFNPPVVSDKITVRIK